MSIARGYGREDGSAARRCPAAALVKLLVLGRVIVAALVLVVVDELRARRDRLDRLDEDALAIVDRLAVRRAGVIDEARIVPLHRRVDHRLVVDGEEEGVVAVHLLVVVALVRRAPGDALPNVLDDAGALLDRANGECSGALDRRGAQLEVRVRLLLPRVACMNPAPCASAPRRALRLRPRADVLSALRSLLARCHRLSSAPDASSDTLRQRGAARAARTPRARTPSASSPAVRVNACSTDASRARRSRRDAGRTPGSRARASWPCATIRDPSAGARAPPRTRILRKVRRASHRTSRRARRRACARARARSFRTALPHDRAGGSTRWPRDREHRHAHERRRRDRWAPCRWRENGE